MVHTQKNSPVEGTISRPPSDAAQALSAFLSALACGLALTVGICSPLAAEDRAYSVTFDRAEYVIRGGETFPVQILISPVPPAGLFSFGVKLVFDPSRAQVVGATAIATPPEFAFNGPFAAAPVTAVGPGFAAVKGTAEFFSVARPNATNAALAAFLVTDLGPGAYDLRLEFFNTLGPTEQIFVDGAGNVLDPHIALGQAAVLRGTELAIDALSLISLNRQTGLFQQTIRVSNRGLAVVGAFRVFVTGLPSGWEVTNSAGATNGVPYLVYNSPLPGGSSVDLRVEYRIPGRDPSSQPAYVAAVISPETPPSPPATEPFAVIPRSHLADGTFLLEFSSLSNRLYSVQYSRDLTAWNTVVPSLTGNGSRVQWIDYGPPRTESHPASETNRYYRVFLLP